MRLLPLFLLAALVSILSVRAEARAVDVVRSSDGIYIVTDVETGTTYGTRDLKPLLTYLANKGKVEGFGGRLTQQQFQKGTEPVSSALYTATDTARSAAKTGLSDASKVPGIGVVVRPLQRLLAATTPKRPAQPLELGR